MELRILKGLAYDFAELRILKDLVARGSSGLAERSLVGIRSTPYPSMVMKRVRKRLMINGLEVLGCAKECASS